MMERTLVSYANRVAMVFRNVDDMSKTELFDNLVSEWLLAGLRAM